MEQLESRKIALRYAKALFEAAEEQGNLALVTDNIRFFQRIYLEIPEITRFFANPGIPLAEKESIVQKQFKKGIAPLVGNLLDLLLANDRITLFVDIMNVFIQLVQDKNGISKADVTVPVAMSDKQENNLKKALEKMFHYKQVELNTKVDPGIIAGVIVKIGDKIIDGSYHGKLEMLRRQLVG